MKRYDVYAYESDSGVIVGWHTFEAEDSKTASEIVQSLGLSGRIELWEGDDLVKRWEAP